MEHDITKWAIFVGLKKEKKKRNGPIFLLSPPPLSLSRRHPPSLLLLAARHPETEEVEATNQRSPVRRRCRPVPGATEVTSHAVASPLAQAAAAAWSWMSACPSRFSPSSLKLAGAPSSSSASLRRPCSPKPPVQPPLHRRK